MEREQPTNPEAVKPHDETGVSEEQAAQTALAALTHRDESRLPRSYDEQIEDLQRRHLFIPN